MKQLLKISLKITNINKQQQTGTLEKWEHMCPYGAKRVKWDNTVKIPLLALRDYL